MAMTYKELGEMIARMPAERQNDDATVLVSGVGEAYSILDAGPVEVVDQQGDVSSVLDNGHWILKI